MEGAPPAILRPRIQTVPLPSRGLFFVQILSKPVRAECGKPLKAQFQAWESKPTWDCSRGMHKPLSNCQELWIRSGVSCPERRHVVAFLPVKEAVGSGSQAARDLGAARPLVGCDRRRAEVTVRNPSRNAQLPQGPNRRCTGTARVLNPQPEG